jgi:hypothetical protein
MAINATQSRSHPKKREGLQRERLEEGRLPDHSDSKPQESVGGI